MLVLALDTSTEWCSVAIGGAESWIEENVHAVHAHSEHVLPMAARLLATGGYALRDIDCVAFGAGPGSFTGLRIACGVAQGIAFGADRPVVPIGTLAAIARAHGGAKVVACLDARMGEVYIAAYERTGDGVRSIREPAVLRPDQVPPFEDAQQEGAGGGFAAYPELARALGLASADPSVRPSARVIGMLAIPEFVAGRAVAAPDALPVYVRHRVALTEQERKAGLRLPTG